MKNKTKKLAGILAAVMALSSVAVLGAGCGKKDDPNVVRIARWSSETDEPKFRAWAQEFEAENPDIKIEWEFKEYGTHFSTLRTDLIGEAAADIIFVNNWGLTQLNLQEKDKGIFVDFSKVESLEDTRDSILSVAKDRMKIGDSVIGMPIGLVTRTPVVNASIWENVSEQVYASQGLDGMPYDRTEAFTGAEIVNLFKAVGTDNNILMGLNVTHTEALHMFLASVGAPLITEDGKIGCNNPAGYEAAQQFQDFMKSGWIVPYSESGGGSYGSVENAIINEKCLAGWGNFATLTNLNDYYASSGQSVATIAPFKAADFTLAKGMDGIAGTADDNQLIEAQDVAYGDFNALVVPSFSTKKDKAYRIIEWMLSKEEQLQYAKMADIPVNADAFEVVTTNSDGNWDPKLYSSYKIGLDNLYLAPVTTSFFANHFTAYFKQLCNGTISGKAFCQAMAEGERYLNA